MVPREAVRLHCYDSSVDYRWKPLQPEPEQVRALSEALGISQMVAALLVNRNITDSAAAWNFLNPRFSDLHDPFLMKDMRKVVDRLDAAIERGERILVYGDYDVDGITATVVLKRALEMLGGRVGYHIPHRLEDGYGMKSDVLDDALRDGYSLVITVDCGTRDFEACSHSREIGLDLIVTDHHLPAEELPEALAVLNPQRPDCGYPDKDLAAVGVALKIIQAMFKERGREGLVSHFLKVVAIGTVADMVPLTGENRTIVKLGLSDLPETTNLGLQALLQAAGVGKRVDHIDVGFKLAPRINAFTRMGGGKEVVDLFSAKSPAEAAAIVDVMSEKNRQRRAEEDRILKEINLRIEEDPGPWQESFLLVPGEGWHRGVLGNVAARLVQRFHRPVIVLSIGEDGAQGSGRSIPGFHLLDSIQHCAHYFVRYGGHAQAAGCTLKPEYCSIIGLEEVRTALQEYAGAMIREADLQPEIPVDAVLPMESVTVGLCRELEKLAPFGVGNPVPFFSSQGVLINGGPWVIGDRHLKLRAQGNSVPVEIIWWRHGNLASRLQSGQRIDLVYTVGREEFRGQERIVLTVKDLRE